MRDFKAFQCEESAENRSAAVAFVFTERLHVRGHMRHNTCHLSTATCHVSHDKNQMPPVSNYKSQSNIY